MTEIVTILRSVVVEQLTPILEEQELTFVLQQLDAVRHEGDDEQYRVQATEVTRAATEAAVAPRLARMRAALAESQARTRQLEYLVWLQDAITSAVH